MYRRNPPGFEVSVAWAPHEYQKNAVKFLLQHPHAALFLDPG